MASSLKVTVDEAGIADLIGDLENYDRRQKKAMKAIVKGATWLLWGQVIQNASGRPGPNIVTGRYISGIQKRLGRDGGFLGFGGTAVGEVWTDAPQAMRLEFGFVGTDSLGRHYTQPPFPHWRPAEDKMFQWATKQAEKVIRAS